tara:strand:- start:1717 stop:1995 length:279 start_codon:yes stop_codon:yes gene_type:complete
MTMIGMREMSLLAAKEPLAQNVVEVNSQRILTVAKLYVPWMVWLSVRMFLKIVMSSKELQTSRTLDVISVIEDEISMLEVIGIALVAALTLL